MAGKRWVMYCVEEEALPFVFGSLPDSVAETFRVTKPSPSPPVAIELDETGTTASLGPLPLQSWVKIPTILSIFEDQHVLCGREVQVTKALTGGTIPF